MSPSKNQIESLNMLGYFQDPVTSDFVCGLVGCRSKVKIRPDAFILVTSATNTISISPKPSFDSLIDSILNFQEMNAPDEYLKQYTNNCICSYTVLSDQYIYAKSKKNKKGSSRNFIDQLVRVKSSNIWSYGLNISLGENSGDLYVQFKNRNGGPGDVYQYFDFPLKIWKRFAGTSSKGHFFWKYIRNNYRYRKLTGDRRGKLPNAIN